MKSVPELKKFLKALLPEGIDVLMDALKKLLRQNTDKFNELLLLEAQYKETNKRLLGGVLAENDADQHFNRIRAALLEFIDDLAGAQLQGNGEQDNSSPDVYNGEVLYRIPDHMQKDVESKCLVRIAFSKETLFIGLDKISEDVVKDLRISDVMGVELIDPSGASAFTIRTFSEQVQFLEKDLPTEWTFYVKPLKVGSHLLLLKISVVEIRDGVERRRNVVLEERVEIAADAITEGKGEKLSSAAIALSLAGAAGVILPPQPEESGGAAIGPSAPVPMAPVVDTLSTRRIEQFVKPKPKKNRRRKLVAVLPLATVLVIASVALLLNLPDRSQHHDVDGVLMKDRYRHATRNGDVKELKNIIAEEPGSEVAIQAMRTLDSLETAAWREAVNRNDPKLYLDRFPEGTHAQEAKKLSPQ